MKGRQLLCQVAWNFRRQPAFSTPPGCVLTPRHLLCTAVEHASDENIINTDPQLHTPVLIEEVIQLIKPKKNQTILDMTFGAGGHTKALLRESPEVNILALDRDETAYKLAKDLAETCSRMTPLHGRFTDLLSLLAPLGRGEASIDAVLIDAGASSMQFNDASRGFSLSKEGPLDMRMNKLNGGITAADVVNNLDQADLYKVIKRYGEERHARVIANAIYESRYAFGRITTTKQLAEVISSLFSGEYRSDKLHRKAHVATKTFQALRIFVNDELNELHNGLSIVNRLLKPGGICVALSFHSLEDRIIKRHFHGIDIDEKFNTSLSARYRDARLHSKEVMQDFLKKDWSWEPVSKKIITPSEEEICANPRARSAKLRAAVKV